MKDIKNSTIATVTGINLSFSGAWAAGVCLAPGDPSPILLALSPLPLAIAPALIWVIAATRKAELGGVPLGEQVESGPVTRHQVALDPWAYATPVREEVAAR